MFMYNFFQHCSCHAQRLSPWLVLIAHLAHCQFILRLRLLRQHFCLASNQVFYFAGYLHATHAALCDLKIQISCPVTIISVMMTGHVSDLAALIWPVEGNQWEICHYSFFLLALILFHKIPGENVSFISTKTKMCFFSLKLLIRVCFWKRAVKVASHL